MMAQELSRAQVVFHLTAHIFECIQVVDDIVYWNDRIICSGEELPSLVYAFQEYINTMYDQMNEQSRSHIEYVIQHHKRDPIMTDAFLTLWYA